jgi:hypothetical protein
MVRLAHCAAKTFSGRVDRNGRRIAQHEVIASVRRHVDAEYGGPCHLSFCAALTLASSSDSGVQGDARTNVATPRITGTGIIGDAVTRDDGSTGVGPDVDCCRRTLSSIWSGIC